MRLKKKKEKPRGTLNISNLNLDLALVYILGLDPSLEIFRFQKRMQFSSVIVKTSANIIKKVKGKTQVKGYLGA